MRHIAALDDGKIPDDDEYNFRIRAKNLADKWHQILNTTTGSPAASTGQANGKTDKEDAQEEDVVTNGTKNIDLNGTSSYTLSLFGRFADVEVATLISC